jgi:hypothetical protein
MTTSSFTRRALPMVAKALLKFSIAILIVGPATLPRGWTLRLFASLTIQFLCHTPALLSLANPRPLFFEWPWRIFATAINFYAN